MNIAGWIIGACFIIFLAWFIWYAVREAKRLNLPKASEVKRYKLPK